MVDGGFIVWSQLVPSSQVPIPQFVPQRAQIHVTQPIQVVIASQLVPLVSSTS